MLCHDFLGPCFCVKINTMGFQVNRAFNQILKVMIILTKINDMLIHNHNYQKPLFFFIIVLFFLKLEFTTLLLFTYNTLISLYAVKTHHIEQILHGEHDI